ncbi:MAG: 4-hydroxythreonine-4-phosphate dehydrogenase PdxA [Bacteroidetes bacterium]|nr:MAG: 4-hydroxythreonine-4-phosphate dehydrogenase PdxA [Bacteroidota bacterium]
MDNKLPVIGVSLGDMNGIGPEVIIKTFSDSRLLKLLTPVVYGNGKIISYYRKLLGANSFNYHQIRELNYAKSQTVNILNCWDESVTIKPGTASQEAGSYALRSLEMATTDLIAQKLDGLVTGPINKKTIQQESFDFPGHTEYLMQRCGVKRGLMLMISENLRIGVVTGHIPLKEVAENITREGVADKLEILEDSLKHDFGIEKPKIAVLGLNPHAGDEGLLGGEEQALIGPLLKELKTRGKLVFGPFPADGFFGSQTFLRYDAVLAMYHDQGLIPFKSLSFGSGVNFTAGLPIIRTSPDHGTAYPIAGKNLADESSFRAALFANIDLIKHRSEVMHC